MFKNCENCNKEFEVCKYKPNTHKFCSLECKHMNNNKLAQIKNEDKKDMNICRYGACENIIKDINPKTGNLYCYCTEHKETRNKKHMKLYYESKGAHNERNKKHLKKIKEDFIKMYGGQCECCGENFEPFLTLDHVQNDGNIDRKKKNGKAHRNSYCAYRDAMKFLDKSKYQILCMNCNFAKRIHGNCPCKSRILYVV